MKITPRLAEPLPIAGIAIAIGVIGWLLRYSTIPLLTFTIAWALIIVSLVPLFYWVRRGANTIPIVGLISLSLGITNGLGAIIQPNEIGIMNRIYEIPWEFMNKALFLGLVGSISLVTTFLALDFTMRRKIRTEWNLRIVPSRRVHAICAIVLAAVFLNTFGRSLLGLGGHVQFGNMLVLLAPTLAAIFYYRLGDRSRPIQVLLIVLVTYAFITGFTFGMLESAVVPLLAFYVVRTATVRRVSLTLLAGALVAFLIVNISKFEYRRRVWAEGEATTTAAQLKLWATIIRNTDTKAFADSSGTIEGGNVTWRSSLSRFSLTNRLAWACVTTPDSVPYLGGDSYRPFLYVAVPRAIWKDKPVISDVLDQIDRTYGFVEDVANAAFGLGYIGEAYVNFGFLGVIMVMMFQAATLFFFNTLLNRPHSEGGAAIFTVLLIGMLNGVGSSLIIIYGNLLQMLVGCVVILLPFTERSRHIVKPARRFLLGGPPPGWQPPPAPSANLVNGERA